MHFDQQPIIGGHVLQRPLGPLLGGELWYATHAQHETPATVFLMTDPEVQIIAREQSVHFDSLTAASLPDGVLPLIAAAPFDEPPFTIHPHPEPSRQLSEVIPESAPLAPEVAMPLVTRCAELVQGLHAGGIAHGILNPGTVYVLSDGQPALGGVGWGRLVCVMLRRSLLSDEMLQHSALGTIAEHLAPEQRESALGYAPPADIYALAGIMFELLTGRPPAEESSLARVACAEARDLDDLFQACRQRDPRQRPDIADFLARIPPRLRRAPSSATKAGLHAVPAATEGNRSSVLIPKLCSVEPARVELPLPLPLKRTTLRSTSGPVETKPFWMAATPVTARNFSHFLRTVTSAQEVEQFIRIDDFCTVSESGSGYVPQRGMGNHPVNGVSHLGAVAYTQWLSNVTGHAFRLPTFAEWLAASGCYQETGRDYPWGGLAPTPEYASFGRRWSDHGFETIEPVDAHLAGAAPCGVLGMAGGVWEWTSTSLAELALLPHNQQTPHDELIMVICGGSWYDSASEIAPRRPRLLPASYRRVTVGFRVASDTAPADL